MNPWGSTFQYSCTFLPVMGFSYLMAKIIWLCSSTGIQKKAYFKSKTVNKHLFHVPKLTGCKGLVQGRCMFMVIQFIVLKSYTSPHFSEQGFFTGKIRILCLDWHSLNSPYCIRVFVKSSSPLTCLQSSRILIYPYRSCSQFQLCFNWDYIFCFTWFL